MRLSTAVTKYLEMNGVEYIFGIPAGTSGPLWDSINDTNIKPIITKNEAGSVYSAANYSDVTNKLSVALLAGGVGMNNAINGIADAYRRKLPVLILSGFVHRSQIGKGAIQELDTEKIVEPITKFSKTLLDENNVLETIENALKIALTPPYGPVHVAIPMDIQVIETNAKMPQIIDRKQFLKPCANNSLIDSAANLINESDKGIIFVGRGCEASIKEIMELSRKLSWNIVTTPEAKGLIYSDFEYNLGTYGFSGTDLATRYVETSENKCVIILGTSLGESATRNYNDVLVSGRKVIHIDWDVKELNKVFKADIAINDSIENVITRLIEKCNPKPYSNFKSGELNKPYECNHTGLSTRLVLEKLPSLLPKNSYIMSDIGEYMNFVIKYLPILKDIKFSISLNYGAMGVAIGGSIGTALANKGNVTAIIVGDGAFFMNGAEVLAAKEYNLPIVYFVINNSMLGYVEHGQKFIYGRQIEGVIQERTSIKDVANAMGIKSVQIEKLEDLDICTDLINNLHEPLIVELISDGTEVPIAADRFKALKDTD